MKDYPFFADPLGVFSAGGDRPRARYSGEDDQEVGASRRSRCGAFEAQVVIDRPERPWRS
jgi:hypothetical protein